MASVIYTANGTSQRTAASTTDKVQIATTTAIAVAVGNSSVAANLTACMIIPDNTVNNDFFVGQGNYIAYINVKGSASPFSVTDLGANHPATGTE